nr:unnamed protein product [Callosobruchus chinensis]
MYLFRVSRPLICKIIPEVCACIIEALKEHVKSKYKIVGCHKIPRSSGRC